MQLLCPKLCSVSLTFVPFLCPISCSLGLTSVQFLCPKSCSVSLTSVQFLCRIPCSLSLTSVQFLCPKSCSLSLTSVQFLCPISCFVSLTSVQFLCPKSCSLSLTSVHLLCPKSCSVSLAFVQFLCALLQGFGYIIARKSVKTTEKHCFLSFLNWPGPAQPPRQFQERCLAPGTCGQGGSQTHNQMQMILTGSAMRTVCHRHCPVSSSFLFQAGNLDVPGTVIKLTGSANPI